MTDSEADCTFSLTSMQYRCKHLNAFSASLKCPACMERSHVSPDNWDPHILRLKENGFAAESDCSAQLLKRLPVSGNGMWPFAFSHPIRDIVLPFFQQY